MAEQFAQLTEALRQFGLDIAAVLPRLLAAALLVVVGWLAARLLRRLTIRVLRLARLDVAAEKAGIEDFLVQGGVRHTAVTLLADLIYWMVTLVVFLAALTALGLGSATELFHRFVLYIPNVAAAVVILIFGSLLAQFVGTLVRTYLSNVRVSGADVISALTRWAILLFVVSLGLEQLSIGGQILVSAFQIAFGAFCFALALAFGLGGRDWASRILSNIFEKR
jgi:hypothetical protein